MLYHPNVNASGDAAIVPPVEPVGRQIAARAEGDGPPRSASYFRPGIQQDWEARAMREAAESAGVVVPLESGQRPRKPTSFFEVA